MKCSNCNETDHEPTAKYCHVCGFALTEEFQPKNMPPKQRCYYYDFDIEGVRFKMIQVDGGDFRMGSNDADSLDDEKPLHKVTLSSYYIGETVVTQALYRAVCGSNPSYFKGYNLPVTQVEWYDAIEFCNKLSKLAGRQPYYHIDKKTEDPGNQNSKFLDEKKWTVTCVPGANGFRLPTEAEWEFAARGGNLSRGYRYSGSDRIDEVAWYKSNSREMLRLKPHPVKTKAANELGIYDMSGNVWEWCVDWHGKYPTNPCANPQGPSMGTARVLRGGAYYFDEKQSRVSSPRKCCWPHFTGETDGFRLALSSE